MRELTDEEKALVAIASRVDKGERYVLRANRMQPEFDQLSAMWTQGWARFAKYIGRRMKRRPGRGGTVLFRLTPAGREAYASIITEED